MEFTLVAPFHASLLPRLSGKPVVFIADSAIPASDLLQASKNYQISIQCVRLTSPAILADVEIDKGWEDTKLTIEPSGFGRIQENLDRDAAVLVEPGEPIGFRILCAQCRRSTDGEGCRAQRHRGSASDDQSGRGEPAGTHHNEDPLPTIFTELAWPNPSSGANGAEGSAIHDDPSTTKAYT